MKLSAWAAVLVLAAPLQAGESRALKFTFPTSDVMTGDAEMTVEASGPAGGGDAVFLHKSTDGKVERLAVPGRKDGDSLSYSRRLPLAPGRHAVTLVSGGRRGPTVHIFRLSKSGADEANYFPPSFNGPLTHLQGVAGGPSSVPAAKTSYQLKVRCRRCGYPKNQRMSFTVPDGMGGSRYVDFYTDGTGCLPREVVEE